MDGKEIGSYIFTVRKGFPLGLPSVEKLDIDLWEIRSHIFDGICRIFSSESKIAEKMHTSRVAVSIKRFALQTV
jgi:hypothetical protein